MSPFAICNGGYLGLILLRDLLKTYGLRTDTVSNEASTGIPNTSTVLNKPFSLRGGALDVGLSEGHLFKAEA